MELTLPSAPEVAFESDLANQIFAFLQTLVGSIGLVQGWVYGPIKPKKIREASPLLTCSMTLSIWIRNIILDRSYTHKA
jgi:hypothetical protein